MDMNGNGKYVAAVGALYLFFAFELIYIMVNLCRRYREPSDKDVTEGGRGGPWNTRTKSMESRNVRLFNGRRACNPTKQEHSSSLSLRSLEHSEKRSRHCQASSVIMTNGESRESCYSRGVDTYINSRHKRRSGSCTPLEEPGVYAILKQSYSLDSTSSLIATDKMIERKSEEVPAAIFYDKGIDFRGYQTSSPRKVSLPRTTISCKRHNSAFVESYRQKSQKGLQHSMVWTTRSCKASKSTFTDACYPSE